MQRRTQKAGNKNMICLTCTKKSKCPIYESTKKTNAKVRKCNGYSETDSSIPDEGERSPRNTRKVKK